MTSEFIKIILTFSGFLITIGLAAWKYQIDRKERERSEKLERIDEQIEKLYGPLFVHLKLSQAVWFTFNNIVQKRKWPSDYETDEQKEAWKAWSIKEFNPSNERIYEIITKNSHLIIEDNVPQVFRKFVTHHAQFKAVINMWEKGGESLFAKQGYPAHELVRYAQSSFKALKEKQYELLDHNESTKEEYNESDFTFENWGIE